MPTVTQFMIESLQSAPGSFRVKEAALAFLNEGSAHKKERALELLQAVGESTDSSRTWATLVADRLVAAEDAMRYLLPTHRDHVIHSAHLYLLGVAIYLKMLRPDAALAAVIADNYYRDAQALFSLPDVPYSCQRGVLNQTSSLAECRTEFPNGFSLTPQQAVELHFDCPTCSPADVAESAVEELQEGMEGYLHCCGPGSAILRAAQNLSRALSMHDWGEEEVLAHFPRCYEDIDAIFFRTWGIASILHDSAYPVELAAKQIEDYVDKTVAPLGCTFSPCPKPFGLQFNRLCDFITVPLIQNVCSDRFNSLMYADNAFSMLAANISHKLHVEYSPGTLATMMTSWLEAGLSAGKIDHGVFSALLMLRQLNHELLERLGDSRGSSSLEYDNTERRVSEAATASTVEYFYIECVDAAAAVYLHNTKTYVELFKNRKLDYRSHPFAWLLFLCDQLQEWMRPSGGDRDGIEGLFRHADSYEILVDTGPKLYFSYPGNAGHIGSRLHEHLRLFGADFVRQAPQTS